MFWSFESLGNSVATFFFDLEYLLCFVDFWVFRMAYSSMTISFYESYELIAFGLIFSSGMAGPGLPSFLLIDWSESTLWSFTEIMDSSVWVLQHSLSDLLAPSF